MEETPEILGLRRRAEEVAPILGANVCQIRDLLLLQRVAIEVAERFSRLEEWYVAQLRERSEYLEHRVTQLAEAAASQTAYLTSDKSRTPTAVRHRQGLTGRAAGMSRPSLSFRSRSPSSNDDAGRSGGAAPSSPFKVQHSKNLNSSRIRFTGRSTASLFALHFQPPTVEHNYNNSADTSRGTGPNRRRTMDMLGPCGGASAMRMKLTMKDKRKSPSSGSHQRRPSKGGSESEVYDTLNGSNSNNKQISTRRACGSTILLSVSDRKHTPRRVLPASSRLIYAVDAIARE